MILIEIMKKNLSPVKLWLHKEGYKKVLDFGYDNYLYAHPSNSHTSSKKILDDASWKNLRSHRYAW